ncbi:MAG: SDR family NAD(P)-dependent oxidoreductase [Rhodopseudomonas palustris]|nr:SDR family NAD(P)-dependent oxidoreductase [Rhodopseudomonas palustris]
MQSPRTKTALVTGASSGIGEALADCFAKGGYNLVLVARSAGKLKDLADRLSATYKAKVWMAPADLAQPDSARRLAAAMKRARRPIDVLVNNAGVLEHGGFTGIAGRAPSSADRPQRIGADRNARALCSADGGARPWADSECGIHRSFSSRSRRSPPMRQQRPTFYR